MFIIILVSSIILGSMIFIVKVGLKVLDIKFIFNVYFWKCSKIFLEILKKNLVCFCRDVYDGVW